MNLRDLEYLLAIDEHGHFAKAAESCHVSQSTLSIQLRKMEEALGVAIFERSKKHVRPTPVGKEILLSARRMLVEAQHIREIARESRDPMAGEVAIGAFPTLAPYYFPLLVSALRASFPKLHPILVEEKTDRLIRQLKEGAIDCVFMAAPVTEHAFDSAPVFFEPFFLAVPAAHKFAKKKSVTLGEVRQEKILLLDEGHCLRGQSLELCEKIGIGDTGNYRATSLETLRNMIAAGAGVTLIPKLARRPGEGVVYLPFAKSAPGRAIHLYWRKTSPRAPLFRNMAKVIGEK